MKSSCLKFPKANRLLKSSDYQRNKVKVRRLETEPVSILIRKNQLELGKLGIIAARRNVKQAVKRNRIKRIIRESFRHHKDYLKGYDVILIAKKNAGAWNKKALRQLLDKQWAQFIT